MSSCPSAISSVHPGGNAHSPHSRTIQIVEGFRHDWRLAQPCWPGIDRFRERMASA